MTFSASKYRVALAVILLVVILVLAIWLLTSGGGLEDIPSKGVFICKGCA